MDAVALVILAASAVFAGCLVALVILSVGDVRRRDPRKKADAYWKSLRGKD